MESTRKEMYDAPAAAVLEIRQEGMICLSNFGKRGYGESNELDEDE